MGGELPVEPGKLAGASHHELLVGASPDGCERGETIDGTPPAQTKTHTARERQRKTHTYTQTQTHQTLSQTHRNVDTGDRQDTDTETSEDKISQILQTSPLYHTEKYSKFPHPAKHTKACFL